MPIRRLLEGLGLGPNENVCLSHERALHGPHLVDRTDPITEVVSNRTRAVRGNSECVARNLS